MRKNNFHGKNGKSEIKGNFKMHYDKNNEMNNNYDDSDTVGHRKFQRTFHYTPMNDKQKSYYDSLLKNVMTIAIGSAGTSKTFTACAFASECMYYGEFDKIILTRANVPTGRTLGAFPGTVEEKLTPWMLQQISYLNEMNSKGAVDCWLKLGKLMLEPLETIRGRSFEDAIIIIDEAQNLTPSEIKTLSTRVGKNSKLIICGDVSQSDLSKKDSGLIKFIDHVNNYNIPDVGIITFTHEDIVRSGLVKDLIISFENDSFWKSI